MESIKYLVIDYLERTRRNLDKCMWRGKTKNINSTMLHKIFDIINQQNLTDKRDVLTQLDAIIVVFEKFEDRWENDQEDCEFTDDLEKSMISLELIINMLNKPDA